MLRRRLNGEEGGGNKDKREGETIERSRKQTRYQRISLVYHFPNVYFLGHLDEVYSVCRNVAVLFTATCFVFLQSLERLAFDLHLEKTFDV